MPAIGSLPPLTMIAAPGAAPEAVRAEDSAAPVALRVPAVVNAAPVAPEAPVALGAPVAPEARGADPPLKLLSRVGAA